MPFLFFFFNDTATTEIYTLSLHDALPISRGVEYHRVGGGSERRHRPRGIGAVPRLQHIGLAPQLGVPAPAPAPSPAALGQAAPCPLLGTRREKYLQRGIREHHRPEIGRAHV